MQKAENVQQGLDLSLFSKIAGFKVGVFPLPLYILSAAIVFGAAFYSKLPIDMIGGFAVIIVMGALLGELGNRIPILKNIGGAAILCIFVPSAMLFYKQLHPEAIKAITAIMKTSNFLYLYIACLVAGSILGMNRKILIQGFLRMFIPLIVGTLAAIASGVVVGLLFGRSPYETFFYIVMPIIGGGIGEGILPMSIAYSEILARPQADFVAMLVPAALLGNVVAIVSAGILKRFAEKRPELSGNGLLVKTGNDAELLKEQSIEKPVDFKLMGAGLLIACTLYIFGNLASKFIGIPGPVIMIFTAALIKVSKVMPAAMEQGAHHMYKFISGALTLPLLVGLGILYVPWQDLIRAFTLSYFLICLATVLGMIASGFFIGKYLNMYPIESAIVTSCHSGLGGTGDVAILSASNRMELMPFAQISTRIGGATMIVVATILMKMFS
jgi:malate:Na+ symporter